MHEKKEICIFLLILAVIVFVTPVTAQMKRIYKFNKVKLPFGVKVEEKVIPKGTYHFEFLRHQTQAKNYMRICKGSKFLCCLLGAEQQYDTYGRMKFKDPNIPKNPRMEFFKHPIKKTVYIVFESGKKTGVYPFLKVKFKLDPAE